MTEWNPAETPDFAPDEMRCRCGCARAEMDGAFMARLQHLRDRLGPLSVSSGYRCPAHNMRVSSTGPDGPHTTGRAADIRVSGARAHELAVLALAEGITGLGVRQAGPHGARFLHIDILTPDEAGGLRPRIWSY